MTKPKEVTMNEWVEKAVKGKLRETKISDKEKKEEQDERIGNDIRNEGNS